MTTERLEESRRRVLERLTEIGDAADREVAKAQKLRDAAVAVLGVVGLLFAARRVGKSISKRTTRRRARAALARTDRI